MPAAIRLDSQSLITPELFRDLSEKAGKAPEAEFETASGQLALILQLAVQGFASEKPAAGLIERLAYDLHQLRRACTPATWRDLIPLAQNHPLGETLRQDPLTDWSARKPRGYSGDASLLDIYYKHPSMDHVVAAASETGQDIYCYTVDVPSCAAGRERCEILARTVDEVAERTGGGAEIFAVAAGHLREAEICSSLAEGKIERWVAVDQDPISIETMQRSHSHPAVQPMEGSVMGLIRKSYDLGTFDHVYASGLYDYLQPKVAIKLLQRMLDHVKPGGSFLFANFSDEITSDGYMETFMDWPLILRSDKDMWEIINAAVDRNLIEADVWYGSNRAIVYGTLRKKA